MSLSERAMIATLNVSCWTARKLDRKVTREVDDSHGANDAGRYNKLLVDKAHLDPLTSFASKIRNTHYELTLPWLDNGGRLLPSKLFMKYRTTMDQLKSEYRALVDKFIPLYDSTLISAARVRLGTMYDATDYPPGWQLRDKFNIDIDIMPVPQGEDFRVDVGDTEREQIQADINARYLARQTDAMNDAWRRVCECVENIRLRTSAPKPLIRESLIENAQELVQLLPGLNVMDDHQLTLVTKAIADNLLVSVWNLRNNSTARAKVAKAAEDILKKIPAAH